jgi:NAD(P)-dependent dehydrogenase (short-subunit alcohol dehydrogenase family)
LDRARIFIADINLDAAQSFVAEINRKRPDAAYCERCDVSSWDDLTSAFSEALKTFDRIDYVFPIAGLTERKVIPKPSEQQDVRKNGFVKPDMTTFDTNGPGMINLIFIAIQAFRGQEEKTELGGMRGKSKAALLSRNTWSSLTGTFQLCVLRVRVAFMQYTACLSIQHRNSTYDTT